MPTITLTLPVAGQDADAGPIATNFTDLQTLLNGGLDAINLADGAVTAPKLATGYANKITRGAMSAGPPGSPATGDIWIATDVGVNGECWHFVYDATETTYKWLFIGGPEVVTMDDGTVTTTSLSYAVPTAGTGAQLTLTAARAGDYIVGHSGYLLNSGANSTQVGLRATGSADLNLALGQAGQTVPYGSQKRMPTINAGGTIQPIVAVSAGTGTYAWRVLWCRPIRVI